jgi:hypothetical protein
MLAGLGVCIVLGGLATCVPLAIGLKAFRQLEP